MIYRPPPHSLKPFSSPPVMQYRIDASNDWQAQNGQVAAIVADAIVQSYSSSISQFIDNQRQQMRLGIIEQREHQFSAPGLDIDWSSNQGDETIRITVKPEYINPAQLPFLIDLNYDGYAAYVLNYRYYTYTNGAQPEVYTIIPINIIVNGYGCILGYKPDPGLFTALPPLLGTTPPETTIPWVQTVILIVAFGSTALRCQSIQDLTLNNIPQLTGSGVSLNTFTAAKGSGGPAGNVSPPRKNIPATSAGGFAVPAHKDLLGYFVFNWEDQFNPDEWAYSGPAAYDKANNINNIFAPDWKFDSLFGKGPPPIVEIIQFENASKSPLNVSDLNTIACQFATLPIPNDIFTANGYGLACAEFYNRATPRVAFSSWNYPQAPAGVLVNDEPLYYSTDDGDPYQSEYGAFTFPPLLNFDLYPADTTAPFQTGIQTFGIFGGTFPVESDQEIAYDAAYNNAVNAVEHANAVAAAANAAAYNAALATLSAAQVALGSANAAIYLVGGSDNSALTLAYEYARYPTSVNLAALETYNNNPSLDALLISYCQASLAWLKNPTNVLLTAAMFAAEVALGSFASIAEFDLLINVANQDAVQYAAAYQIAYAAAIAAGSSVPAAMVAGLSAEAAAQAAFLASENAVITYAVGEPANAAAATTAMNNLVTAQNAFDALAVASTPQYITPQFYKSISGFKYRKITFAKGIWTFGAYS